VTPWRASGGSRAATRQLEAEQAALRVVGGALDVSVMPTFAFGHRSILWWATMWLVAIEGTVFALAGMAWFYLRSHAAHWPLGSPPPELVWGTLNTAILLASLVPNQWTKRAAEKLDRRRVRIGLVVCLLFSFAFLAVRVLEFRHLNVGWDQDAYGSIVWMLMGLHTLHLITDTWDSGVLTALFLTGPREGRRYVDVSENALYWYFVVLAWLPIYALVYWGPRGVR
jgi:cytochrome c oxidase subunit III